MKTTAYIILKKTGPVRMTRNPPGLGRDEIAIALRLEVPDSAFRAPTVFVDLSVPESAVLVPVVHVEAVEQDPAPVGTRPEGQDGAAGLVRSTSDAVPCEDRAGAQGGDA
jgi:hypothetical protein